MARSRRRIALPIIELPKDENVSVLAASPGFTGPFISGKGDLDLLCGSCFLVLARAVWDQTIANLILKCPSCNQYNAVFSPSTYRAMAKAVLAEQLSVADLAHIELEIKKHRANSESADEAAAAIRSDLSDHDWLAKLLVPRSAGEFYSMLACILAVIAILKPMLSKRQFTTSIVVNNYYASVDPFKGTRAGDPCPCGSGKEYGRCHQEKPA